jgi:hypothetical protein
MIVAIVMRIQDGSTSSSHEIALKAEKYYVLQPCLRTGVFLRSSNDVVVIL